MTQSFKEAPLVSIITPNLNRADMQRDSIVSVYTRLSLYGTHNN